MKRIALLLALALPAGAADYYVSPAGKDSDPGTPAKPWQSINHAIASVVPGDTIHLQAGATFVENVYFAPGTGGTNGAPITLTSDALNRATLTPATTNGNAIYVYNSGYLTFSNLVFVGQGIGTNQATGVQFYADNGRYAGLRLANLDCSGFGGRGLVVGGWSGTTNGFQDVVVENCRFHHNDGAGFYIYGQYKTSHANLTVRNCQADNSRSADGILVNGVTGGLVEHCVAHDNGAFGNGRVGIWTYGVDGVTIQYCESYNNRTSGTADGGGFDFDGGTVNSVMQYNYSHGNDGDGFALYQYNGAATDYGPLQNNVIRYNISENDGRRNSYGGISIWGDNTADFVSTNDIYHNTIFVGGMASNGSPAAVRYIGANFRGLRLRNNLFIAANGLRLLNADSSMATNIALHQGNDWWPMPGTQFQIKYGSTVYSNLPAWRATNNERLAGNDVGYSLDPRLTAPGNGTTNGYTLQSDSPLIDAALNLIAAPGNFDYFGNTIPQGATYDVGAHDTKPNVSIAGTADAFEFGPSNGTFTVTRTGGTITNLTVAIAPSGTAQNGPDYALLPVTLNIPVGASNAVLTVAPIPDDLAEGDETVTVALVASNLYNLGTSPALITLHDKPIDAWRFQHFAGNPPGSGDTDDPDGDGLPNLLEYALNTDPLTPTAGPTLAVDHGFLTLTYTRTNPAPADVLYQVGVSGDLSNWCFAASCTTTQATVNSNTATVKESDTVPVSDVTRRFMKLQITRP